MICIHVVALRLPFPISVKKHWSSVQHIKCERWDRVQTNV